MKLLEWQLNPDEIYSLIATKKLYVDLSAADLASEAEKVRLFLSSETAHSTPQRIESGNFGEPNPQAQGFINPTIGSQIVWDGIDWLVLNLGQREVTLLNSQQNVINLPITVFEQLITQKQLNSQSGREYTNNEKPSLHDPSG